MVIPKFNVIYHTMVKLFLASGLGLVRVLKSMYGSQLSQPRCHLGFAHVIVYGQATTSYIGNIVPHCYHAKF